MSVVKILLVLGLGYIAVTQKKEKTRNMLLIVTGLLAFCMFSAEGFELSTNHLEARCVETATAAESVPEDLTACAGVTALTDETACSAVTHHNGGAAGACTYIPATRPPQPSDLQGLFPSCTAGNVVKDTPPTQITGGLCSAPIAPPKVLIDDFCGSHGSCSGSLTAPSAADDKSNVCSENIFGYQSTCECTEEGKTWTAEECITTPPTP
jgi:hypothetical protein